MQKNNKEIIYKIREGFNYMQDNFSWSARYCNELIRKYLKVEPDELDQCTDYLKLMSLYGFLKKEYIREDENKQLGFVFQSGEKI